MVHLMLGVYLLRLNRIPDETNMKYLIGTRYASECVKGVCDYDENLNWIWIVQLG